MKTIEIGKNLATILCLIILVTGVVLYAKYIAIKQSNTMIEIEKRITHPELKHAKDYSDSDVPPNTSAEPMYQ